MNLRFGPLWARFALACLLLAVGISGLGAGNGSVSSSSFANPSFAALAASLDTWSAPQDESGGDAASDTASSLAVAPNGSVTIAWERQGSDHVYLLQRSNTVMNGSFGAIQTLDTAPASPVEHNIHTVADSQGRRHVVWWTENGGQICDAYARVDADGVAHVNQTLDFTCLPNGSSVRKNVALAVGPDDSLSLLTGWNLHNLYYSHMTAAGTWDVQNELVFDCQCDSSGPKNVTIGVSSEGKVMVAWVGPGGGRNDVLVSVRQGANSWSATTNVSTFVCGGNAHLPALARDSSGGMRLAWSQVQCGSDPNHPADDVYYREWTPSGGWSSGSANPSHQDDGDSIQSAITVDSNGVAHIMWIDNSNDSGQYQVYYSRGRISTGLTDSGAIFASYAGGAYQKEISLGQNPPSAGVTSTLHVTFSSNVTGNKEVYYSNSAGGSGGGCSPPGTFSDVPSSAYYYQAAHDLSTASPPVISGYSDCTFHPEASITRGQTAKIVVLGANRANDTHGGPHFSDVPTSNPFYNFIETAYNDGIISGYACGTGCLEFRPGDNVTRAQFSKMAILAFGFPTNLNGAPHFSDVPIGTAFYNYVETAFNRSLISGYDGGLFKPNDELTRGQAAKITYQARR